MAEELTGNLSYETPQSDTKHQKLLECVLTGNSKQYLGKVYTEEQLAKLNEEEVEKLFNNHEAKLSGQMVKSLGKSIINMYSMGACSALGIRNQEALSEDLENNPFLNSALQRFTCELYYRFGSFLAPLTLSYLGGGGKIHPPPVFPNHPKTAQGIKLKLSDFKDTLLRHILQVKPVP